MALTMSIPAGERLDPESIGLVGRPASRELVSVRQCLDALTAHLTVQPTTYRCKTETRRRKQTLAVVLTERSYAERAGKRVASGEPSYLSPEAQV
jgi:hypothetical protein